MYADEARAKFWKTLRETLKELGEPFFFTENKQWAIINKKTINYHEPCVALDFLWRDEFLRINVYIENDIPLYNKLRHAVMPAVFPARNAPPPAENGWKVLKDMLVSDFPTS